MNQMMGHNLPDDTEATLDALTARTNALVETADKWARERPEITSDDEARKAGDFLDQLRAQIREIEDERKRIKQPHMDAAKAVDERYNPLKRPVEMAGQLIKGLLTKWLQRQEALKAEERRRAEEKARKEREAAEKAAREAAAETASIAQKAAAEDAQRRAEEAEKSAKRAATGPKIASDYGRRSKSLRSRTIVEIEDATKIPAKFLRRLCAKSYVTDALERAVRDDVAAYSRETEDGGLASTVPGIVVRKEKVAA